MLSKINLLQVNLKIWRFSRRKSLLLFTVTLQTKKAKTEKQKLVKTQNSENFKKA